MNELLIVVPTRSRPFNVVPVVNAWVDTGAFDDATLLFAIDVDDPAYADYQRALESAAGKIAPHRLHLHSLPRHEQLVPKLNSVSAIHAQFSPEVTAVGFAGDDHRPRTPGWARRFLDELREMKTGIVYPDDGYQHENIPTSWAMTADIVRALDGRQVPAPVEHLFCDNAVRDLGRAAGCLRYLPDVLVEHLHPVVGKAESDEQYERVNARPQWRADRRTYREWQLRDLPRQAAAVRALMMGEKA